MAEEILSASSLIDLLFLQEEVDKKKWSENFFVRNNNLFYFVRFYVIYIFLISFQTLNQVQTIASLLSSAIYSIFYGVFFLRKNAFKNWAVLVARVIFEIAIFLILVVIRKIQVDGSSIKRSKTLILIVVVTLISELIYCIVAIIINICKLSQEKRKKKIISSKGKKSKSKEKRKKRQKIKNQKNQQKLKKNQQKLKKNKGKKNEAKILSNRSSKISASTKMRKFGFKKNGASGRRINFNYKRPKRGTKSAKMIPKKW